MIFSFFGLGFAATLEFPTTDITGYFWKVTAVLHLFAGTGGPMKWLRRNNERRENEHSEGGCGQGGLRMRG